MQIQKVHKHVYVHVAPDEPVEETKVAKSPKPKLIPEKHYKILFIKAPTPTPYVAPEIPEVPPPPETKTLVYVLLKKPDPTPAIVLTTPAPTKPSKPEVYFIRYKSPNESQGQDQDAKLKQEYGTPGVDRGAPQGPDREYGTLGVDRGAPQGPDREYGVPGAGKGAPQGPDREYGIPGAGKGVPQGPAGAGDLAPDGYANNDASTAAMASRISAEYKLPN
jgi:hypothetical protein